MNVFFNFSLRILQNSYQIGFKLIVKAMREIACPYKNVGNIGLEKWLSAHRAELSRFIQGRSVDLSALRIDVSIL